MKFFFRFRATASLQVQTSVAFTMSLWFWIVFFYILWFSWSNRNDKNTILCIWVNYGTWVDRNQWMLIKFLCKKKPIRSSNFVFITFFVYSSSCRHSYQDKVLTPVSPLIAVFQVFSRFYLKRVHYHFSYLGLLSQTLYC